MMSYKALIFLPIVLRVWSLIDLKGIQRQLVGLNPYLLDNCPSSLNGKLLLIRQHELKVKNPRTPMTRGI